MTRLNAYEQTFKTLAPELDPAHVLTLAYEYARTLDAKPHAFFVEIAGLARQMGAARLARLHTRETGRAL
ncbi:hypothetical protein [Breoghania sp.]|uniref:hypothetical protein n=1 Tax=Breoghania sp. TaxID=2065378 RepID=UPI002AA9146D|nr:hypothetical protein [Breoghania sp.]